MALQGAARVEEGVDGRGWGGVGYRDEVVLKQRA